LAFAGAAVLGLHAEAVADPHRTLLASTRCADAALRQLDAWDARPAASLPDPPGPTGYRGLRIPTSRLGVWLRLLAAPGGDILIERITEDAAESLDFDARCAARTTMSRITAGLPSDADVHPFREPWRDASLADRLAVGDTGIILVWSPHMPLSVDQYAILRSAATDLGLAFVPMLDPVADAGYAERIAAERGLRIEALRPLRGIELAFRGMTTHTPSVQLFSGGRLVGPVLFGYRGAEGMRAAILGALGRPG
jgi:hypothetical protein